MTPLDRDGLIESWSTRDGVSEHLRLELAANARRNEPLAPGEPVPGCGCSDCTGVESDDRHDTGRRTDPDLPVDRARRASIRRVAERLHLGVPEKQGRECVVECPFHADEHPSLRLNESDGLWYCFPCGEGGDTIELVQRVRRVGFKRAVKWIARRTRPRGR